MAEVILALNSTGKSVSLALVNTSLQVTLLILLVWFIIRILRLRSAATRYYLWFLTVFGVLALPLLGALLPGINFQIMGSEEAIIKPMYMGNNADIDRAVRPVNTETNTATMEEASPKRVEGAGFDIAQWEDAEVSEPLFHALLNLAKGNGWWLRFW